MDQQQNDLGTMFQAWTQWAGLAFSVTVFFAATLGLILSLISFVNMFRHVRERSGDPGGSGVPFGHLLAVIIAGLISMSGLIFGMASLLWSPA